MSHAGAAYQARRVQQLTEHLQKAVTEFRAREAKLTDAEVRQALQMAAPAAPGDRSREAAIGIGIACGVLGLILGVGAFVSNSGSKGGAPVGLWVLLAFAMTACLGAFLVVRLRD